MGQIDSQFINLGWFCLSGENRRWILWDDGRHPCGHMKARRAGAQWMPLNLCITWEKEREWVEDGSRLSFCQLQRLIVHRSVEAEERKKITGNPQKRKYSHRCSHSISQRVETLRFLYGSHFGALAFLPYKPHFLGLPLLVQQPPSRCTFSCICPNGASASPWANLTPSVTSHNPDPPQDPA